MATTKTETLSCPAIRVQQPLSSFFAFSLRADVLNKITYSLPAEGAGALGAGGEREIKAGTLSLALNEQRRKLDCKRLLRTSKRQMPLSPMPSSLQRTILRMVCILKMKTCNGLHKIKAMGFGMLKFHREILLAHQSSMDSTASMPSSTYRSMHRKGRWNCFVSCFWSCQRHITHTYSLR